MPKVFVRSLSGSGQTDIKYHPSKDVLFMSCNVEGAYVLDAKNPAQVDSIASLKSSTDAYSCIAVHPDGTELCLGTEEYGVARFRIEAAPLVGGTAVDTMDVDGDDEMGMDTTEPYGLKGFVVRLTTRVRCLTYSPTGGHIFVASEDPVIRQVLLADISQVSRYQTGSSYPISIAVDPEMRYLSAFLKNGSLMIFDIASKQSIFQTQIFHSRVAETSPLRHGFVSSTEELIVPGPRGLVVLDVPSSSKNGSFKIKEDAFAKVTGHPGEVSTMAISPLECIGASCGSDQTILIWDLKKREIIDRHRSTTLILGMDFFYDRLSKRLDLAFVTADGEFGIWPNVIPAHMVERLETFENTAKIEKEKKMKSRGETAKSGLQSSNFVDDVAEMDGGEDDEEREDEAKSDRKHFEEEVSSSGFYVSEHDAVDKKHGIIDDEDEIEEEENDDHEDSDDDDDDDDEGTFDLSEYIGQSTRDDERSRRASKGNIHGDASGLSSASFRRQKGFQSSATPFLRKDLTRFLCMNEIGSVVITNEHTQFAVDVDFVDLDAHRSMRFKDRYGFTTAFLSPDGIAFGTGNLLESGDKSNPLSDPSTSSNSVSSVLWYKPLEAWSENSDWFTFFRNEYIVSVACGKNWVACGTSKRYLRIFTCSGYQRHILLLPYEVLSLTGKDDRIAVLMQSTTGQKHLMVFDAHKQQKVIPERCIGEDSMVIEWIGFSENNILCIYDKSGCVYAVVPEIDDSLVPVFDASTVCKSPKDHFFLVAVYDRTVSGVIVKNGMYPRTTPKPIPEEFAFHAPALGGDYESKMIPLRIQMHALQRKLVDGGASLDEDDTKEMEGEVLKLEIEKDSLLLKMVSQCCEKERSLRALDCSSQLALRKSMEGAIELAQMANMPALAQRMHMLLESRFGESKMRHVADSFEPTWQRIFQEQSGYLEDMVTRLSQKRHREMMRFVDHRFRSLQKDRLQQDASAATTTTPSSHSGSAREKEEKKRSYSHTTSEIVKNALRSADPHDMDEEKKGADLFDSDDEIDASEKKERNELIGKDEDADEGNEGGSEDEMDILSERRERKRVKKSETEVTKSPFKRVSKKVNTKKSSVPFRKSTGESDGEKTQSIFATIASTASKGKTEEDDDVHADLDEHDEHEERPKKRTKSTKPTKPAKPAKTKRSGKATKSKPAKKSSSSGVQKTLPFARTEKPIDD
eukprot:TRINITY_DN413_c1_g1_i2.p1 TRINITY_DN413_c1_g1~~TRINITY_DN413_c1_g1_i2.p1  ORF type:complete len:1197 (+),score=411.94 TRINITY_DN413_c1_g1_i2:194-3784(+)